MIVFMYVFCILAWGLNFIAVKIQGTPVALELSLTYRLAGAALLFIAFACIRRPSGFFASKDLVFLASFGVSNFSLSYLFLYYATILSNAALVTLIFSLKTVLTPLALRVFLGDQLRPRIFIGGLTGCLGVCTLIYPLLENSSGLTDLKGIGLALFGTMLTSVGDACSARNARHCINPVYSNSVGFVVATFLMLIISYFQGHAFDFPTSTSYIGSLIYLTVVASFFAWMFYLKLIEKIGAAASSYMVAMFPAVGGIASVMIGDSEPTLNLLFGCIFCTMGAVIALGGLKFQPRIKIYRYNLKH